MPNRILREGIISSPRINALSMGAEVLYRRLMSIVDDYGRYHASPMTVRSGCWPTCPEKISHLEVLGWMEELAGGTKPLLSFYKVDDAIYLCINDFGQKPRSKSKFPAPENGVACNLSADCQQNARTMRYSYSYSYSQSYTEKNGSREAAQKPVALISSDTDFPKLTAAVQNKFPSADSVFIRRLIQATSTAILNAGYPEHTVTDDSLARAVQKSLETDNVQRAGLFLATIPRIMLTWAKNPPVSSSRPRGLII